MSGSLGYLGFRRSLSLSVLLVFIASTFFVPAYAVDAIPRDKLVVEYMFNGGVADTSGNANTVVNSGATFGVDNLGPINYASFEGVSQIAGLTGWSGSSFAISFWVKTPLSGRVNAVALAEFCRKLYPSYEAIKVSYDSIADKCTYNGNYIQGSQFVNVSQSFFSSTAVTGYIPIGMILKNDYTCEFHKTSLGVFDCSKLKDQKWHHFVVKKDDYNTLTVHLDGVKILTQYGFTGMIGRAIKIGQSSIGSTSTSHNNNINEGTNFFGQIGAFRLFRTDVTEQVIADLYMEYPLLQTAQIDPATLNIPVITIREPSSTPESFKKISAVTSKGVLQMSLTKDDKCDNSLVFEEYSPLTFNNVTDNGTRMCYKATIGNITTYKSSNKIFGITTESSLLLSTDNIFAENAYLTWSGSRKKNPTDFMFNIISVIGGGRSGANFVDMNGDGLVDVLYYNTQYSALLVNNGDYTFSVKYKCYTANNPVTYYGDCADTNYKF